MLQSLLQSPLLLTNLALVWLIVPNNEVPWWDLAPTPLKFGEKGGVFLQDPNDIPPVLSVEIINKAVLGKRWSWALREGAGSMRCALWETDADDLWDVVT